MAPVLLDARAIIKIGTVILILLLATFIGGFVFGYQKAVYQQLRMTTERVLDLPESVVISEEEFEPHIPETVTAGRDIDVDRPDATEPASLEHYPMGKVGKADVNRTVLSSVPVSETIKSVGISDNKSANTVEIKAGTPTTESSPNTDNGTDTVQVELVEASVIHRNTASYSIQAGVFSRRQNAENQVKLLVDKGLDAYLSDYQNKNQQTRYNVRIGYFDDKASAINALKQYRNLQRVKSGYLVKLSRTLHAETALNSSDDSRNKTAEF